MAVDLLTVRRVLLREEGLDEEVFGLEMCKDSPVIDITKEGEMTITTRHADMDLEVLTGGVVDGGMVYFRFGGTSLPSQGIPLRIAGRLLKYCVEMPCGTAVLTHEDHPDHDTFLVQNQKLYGCHFDRYYDGRFGRCTCPPGLKGLGAFCNCGE